MHKRACAQDAKEDPAQEGPCSGPCTRGPLLRTLHKRALAQDPAQEGPCSGPHSAKASGEGGMRQTVAHALVPAQGIFAHALVPEQGIFAHALVPAQGIFAHVLVPAQGIFAHALVPEQGIFAHALVPAQGIFDHALVPAQGIFDHALVPAQGVFAHFWLPTLTFCVHALVPASGKDLFSVPKSALNKLLSLCLDHLLTNVWIQAELCKKVIGSCTRGLLQQPRNLPPSRCLWQEDSHPAELDDGTLHQGP